MAFGASDNDIDIKVTLDTASAEKQAQQFKNEAVNALKGIQQAAQSPISALSDLGKQFAAASPKVQSLTAQVGALATKFAPMAGYIIGATVAIKGLTVGFEKLISVAADGDKFGDISDALAENATQAGLTADALTDRLGKAFQNTVDNATLAAQANKAFAYGIDPKVFDDLAAAAKRYADSVGGDAVQSLDELLQGVKTGREGLVAKFGTIKDGVLILKEFTDAEYQNAIAQSKVTDVYERYQTSLKNLYQEFAQVVNSSTALKTITEAVTGALYGLVFILEKAAVGIIKIADALANGFNVVLNETLASISYMVSLGQDLANGTLPDFSKALKVSNQFMAGLGTTTDKAGKVTIKLKQETDKGAKSLKDLAKEAKAAKEAIEKIGNITTDSIEKAFGFKSVLETKIQKDVAGAFRQFKGNDPALVSALERINREILAGITDPEEAKKAADTLMTTIQEQLEKRAGSGVSGPNIAAGLNDLFGTSFNANGGFFGFDIGESSKELADALSSSISQALSLASKAVEGGVGREDAAAIGSAIGTVIGAAIGSYFGPAGTAAGAGVGSVAGGIFGQIAAQFGKDGAGTQARKAVDKWFGELFDADRLTVIVDGQLTRIRDLVFNQAGRDRGGLGGASIGGGAASGNNALTIPGALAGGLGSNQNNFNSEQNAAFLNQQAAQIQGSFNAVGAAMEQLLGVTDELAGQIGQTLANNIGANLENLQVLIQSTGKTFQEFGDALFQSFFNGNLSLEELLLNMASLNDLFTAGLPGVGQVAAAVDNFNIALQDGKGSRVLIDSLRDIGAETQELGKDLGAAAQSIAAGLGLGAEKVTLLLQAMKLAGINSIQELVDASNIKLATLAGNIKQVTAGGDPTNTPISDPTAGITPASNFGDATRAALSRGGSGSSARTATQSKAEQERKRALEALRSETLKTVTASTAYAKILDQLNAGTITAKKAGDELQKLYQTEFKVLKTLREAQEAYNKALEKGVKGKELADLAAGLKRAETAAGKLTDKLNPKTGKFIDLSGLNNIILDLNSLGVVTRAVGGSIEQTVDTLVQGFLRGKLSIEEVNKQITATKDILGKGIPGAIGAVDAAFANLQKGGNKGGLFSVDAFRDIFTEFEELFGKNAGPARQKQFKILTDSYNAARDALQQGIDAGDTPERIADLQKAFRNADASLQDFNKTVPKAGLEDLREQLKKTFSGKDVDAFFRALQESGLSTFDEFANAGNEAVIGILGNLKDLGFSFAAETDANITRINTTLDAAIVKQAEGLDLLKAELTTISTFINTAAGLPAFITGLNDPLKQVAEQFGNLLVDMALLTGRDHNVDVILNVRTRAADQATQDILDRTFGDGTGTSDGGSEGPGTGHKLNKKQRAEFDLLRRKAKTKQGLTAGERRRLDALNDIRDGV